MKAGDKCSLTAAAELDPERAEGHGEQAVAEAEARGEAVEPFERHVGLGDAGVSLEEGDVEHEGNQHQHQAHDLKRPAICYQSRRF